MSGVVERALVTLVPLVVAIVGHEVAHGFAARALGDRTAQDAGRLTLNPLKHVDMVGTVLLPLGLALAHLPVFGWAKPVPVDARRLRHPRRDMMLVALAGPGANLVMGLLAAVGLGLLVRHLSAGEAFYDNIWGEGLIAFFQINLYLALFNLLPVPPFDGSHVVEGLLPQAMAQAYRRARRWGMLLPMLLLVVVPYVFPNAHLLERLMQPPFAWVSGHYLQVADWIAHL